jgi:hypothetical protein
MAEEVPGYPNYTYPDFGGDPSQGTTPAPPGPPGAGAGPCPPGQTRHPTRGDCRYVGDYPCPAGLCKDVASGECRTFNPRREKVNETDITERETGGGRGYCKKLGGGRGGGGAGGGGGFGAGGGGGAGGPGGGQFGISDPGGRFSELFGRTEGNFQSIWDSLLPVARGEQTRYNPETMGYLEGQARVDRAGNIDAGTESIYSDAITRGMGRSGPTSAGVSNVVRDANRTYASTVTQMRVKKVEQDFEDRMGALDRMQKALDSRQAYILGLDQTAAQREQSITQIALGYARIAAERQMLEMRLNTDLQIAQNQNMTNILLGT